MKGVFLDLDSMGDQLNLTQLTQVITDLTTYPTTAAIEVIPRIADAEVVIVNKVILGKTELHACKHLKLIAVTATGTNNIDLEAARTLGIRVCNVIQYGRPTIVQHTFSLLLALANNLLDYHQDVRSKRWHTSPIFCLMDHPIVELEGKTMGILGYGDLGRGVAKMAEAFGMKVIIGARPGQASDCVEGYQRIPLDEMLAKVDVLSLHCLLSEQTKHIINAEALTLMKPSAFLINVARGGLVDEQALADALINKRLAGAALDVLSTEPPTKGNVLLDQRIPNLIITPHCAWASKEARQRLLDKTANNIALYKQNALTRFVV